jgi:hypothetical protein
MFSMSDEIDSRPTDSPIVRSSALDGPVDVQKMDGSGEVDLGQLEFNLSLTPAERIEQNDSWIEFIHIARQAGRRLYGEETST